MSTSTSVVWLSLILLVTAPGGSSVHTLRIDRDHFTVDGAPRFLIFVSYFDAMRRANAEGGDPLAADFSFFEDVVDGIRIFPNWWNCAVPGGCGSKGSGATDSLIDSSGRIRDAATWSGPGLSPWDRFVAVLTAAGSRGLLVDVTFSRETIANPPAPSDYAKGIHAVIRRLRMDRPDLYGAVFFDVQNEWQLRIDRGADIEALVNAAHAADAAAIVTGSQTQVTAAAAGANAAAHGFDLVAYHDPRSTGGARWHLDSTISADIAAIRAHTTAPIVYDEPTAWCEPAVSRCSAYDDSRSAHFVDAATRVKHHGGALWTFHTRSGFDLARAPYVSKASGAERDTLREVRAATDRRPPSSGTLLPAVRR